MERAEIRVAGVWLSVSRWYARKIIDNEDETNMFVTKEEFVAKLERDPFGRAELPLTQAVYLDRLWQQYSAGLIDGRGDAVDRIADHWRDVLDLQR